VSAPTPEANSQTSTGRRGLPGPLAGLDPTGLALVGVVALASALLLVAEFTPVFEVTIGTLDTVRRTKTGGANHAYALIPIALLAVPMAIGAARGARPPAIALVVLGAVALAIALAVDLPSARESGSLPEADTFEDAQAQPASGFYLETLGAVLLIVAGGLTLLLRRDEPRGPGSRRAEPRRTGTRARERTTAGDREA
jgi:hypothetical protein